ncbi:MAG: sigma 54-interacting transcriptional regulator, partial [Nitrospinota bacterium]
LRVLEDHSFKRVGGTSDINVDIRVIAATNRELRDEVKDGKFREDLFYRLNVLPIHLPPLRERREDIPLLVEYFLTKF